MRKSLRPLCAVVAAALLAGCAHSPPYDPYDPLEPVNRRVFSFNQTLDRHVVRPVARTYRDVTPSPVRQGVGNFFDNVGYPVAIVNSPLQGKFHKSAVALSRFVVNSTLGFAGLVDVATHLGLEEVDEDFGQTLGVWGLGPGAYLMLPILGPSSGRGLVGRGADQFAEPLNLIEDIPTRIAIEGFGLLDQRARLIGFDQAVYQAFDPYSFVRTAYLENRLNKVYDGHPPKEQLDDVE